MRGFFKAFLLFSLIFSVAYIARMLTVPDVVPIADAEQSGWPVQIAFVLTSVQNVGLFGIALVVLLAILTELRNLLPR